MAAANVEDAEWEELNRTNWKGLGLTDPIKNIEVCEINAVCLVCVANNLTSLG